MPTANVDIGKELIAMDIASLIKAMGVAVSEVARDGAVDFAIPEAEIELKIALHVKKDTTAGGTAGGTLCGVGLNANYQSSFGYSADGASTIKVKFRAISKG